MNQVNYNAMSDAELKKYFLTVIASPGDPDFDGKIQAAIRQQIQASPSDSETII